MPRAPSQEKKIAPKTSVISPPMLNKQGTAGLTPMNVRVSVQFHREFKLYAVQHGMSMVDLLEEHRAEPAHPESRAVSFGE
jgi:hypothetical protein